MVWVSAAEPDAVHTYTSDELDRMFGPAAAAPSDPVDKSGPEDWRWVEQFLDRQYARVDADRRYDLGRRVVDYSEPVVQAGYYGPVAWRLGYPASTWWNTVASRYGVRDLTPYRYGSGPSMFRHDGGQNHDHDHGRGHGAAPNHHK